MKKNLLAKSVVLMACISLLAVGTSSAQEVAVAPGFNTLLDAVTANPDGATFVLERGGAYVIDQAVKVNAASTFTCAATPVETMPAVISVFANPGEGSGINMFELQANATFENLGFEGITTDEQQTSINIFCKKDSLEITIDGCIFQGSRYCFANDEFDHVKYTAINNIYFNVMPTGQDNSGGYCNLWGGTENEILIQNNTYFNSGRCFNFANAGPMGAEVLNHNSYVNTWGDPFFPVIIENFTLTNSLFYNANIRGYVGVRYAGDSVTYPGDYSDYSLDTVAGDLCVYPHASDDGAGRILAVNNNLKMYEQKVLDFYAANDIMANPFVSPTTMVLAPEHGWAIQDNLLQADGNAVDPEFAMGAIPDEAYTKLFAQAVERRLPSSEQGEGYPYYMGWLVGDVGMGEFIWPLPFDLEATNRAVWDAAEDGFPVGDLNWYTDDVKAAWEAGEENPLMDNTAVNPIAAAGLEMSNFPNPFGTSTKITYSIAENSMVVMTVYNVSGAEVATLVNENQSAGSHEVQFSGNELESGMYFCKLQAGHKVVIRKIALVK